MVVTINAVWHESWKDYGCASEMYELLDKYDDERSVLELFERIAKDFAKHTDDGYAKEQIGCGFNWGVFFDCVDDAFLYRYGVRRLKTPKAMCIDVMHSDCFEVD